MTLRDPKEWESLSQPYVERAFSRPSDVAQAQSAVASTFEHPETTFQKVTESLTPLPSTNVFIDEEDDMLAFHRATAKSAAHEHAKRRLQELEDSPDPKRYWAGLVLRDAHDHLKELQLEERAARLASTPVLPEGVTLAEALWQGRNQAEHFKDTKSLGSHVLQAWSGFVRASPGTFGLATPPADDPGLQQLLKQQSWTVELFTLIGWTTPQRIITSARSIQK